jgi:hypothetical protein
MVSSMNCLDRFQYCYGEVGGQHYHGSGGINGEPPVHDRIPEEGSSASSSRQGSDDTDSPRRVIREIIV